VTDGSPLRALLAREPAPPIDRAALCLAGDFDPSLDLPRAVADLDALAAPLAGRIARARSARDVAAELGTWLFDERGFRGDEDTYYDPRNSYLHEVLARRAGIPITLAIVLIGVARRVGVRVEGVGFPGHFLARVHGNDADDSVLVDPFFRGREVTAPVLDALARRALGDPSRLRAEHLAAASPRAMILRMLTNLRGAHQARGDTARALVACDRIVDLTDAPEARRDRGRMLLAMGATEAAVADLEAWLAQRPDAPDAAELRQSIAQARAVKPRPLQ
jgi:regulator of sirC expression with transglutaminase-like and TPR domain